MKSWERIIGKEELEVYRRAGYGRLPGEGRRPAVLVVDIEYNFTGEKPEPILKSIAKFRNSCGEAAWTSIPQIARLLRVARSRRIPIFYTHGFTKTSGVTRYEARMGTDIVRQLGPRRGDVVYSKEAPSAFFGTPLAGQLVGLGVDTVLVIGCTTSGCVRATVVDAYSYRFRVIVVEDCVFDRAITPHRANLFDMAQKYAVVRSLAHVEAWLRRLPVRRGRAQHDAVPAGPGASAPLSPHGTLGNAHDTSGGGG